MRGRGALRRARVTHQVTQWSTRAATAAARRRGRRRGRRGSRPGRGMRRASACRRSPPRGACRAAPQTGARGAPVETCLGHVSDMSRTCPRFGPRLVAALELIADAVDEEEGRIDALRSREGRRGAHPLRCAPGVPGRLKAWRRVVRRPAVGGVRLGAVDEPQVCAGRLCDGCDRRNRQHKGWSGRAAEREDGRSLGVQLGQQRGRAPVEPVARTVRRGASDGESAAEAWLQLILEALGRRGVPVLGH
mmetsp:Transcript_16069/g.54120  ORF Transcript_16069/g.54120 Transcript_16069/m.54120 type:complete len:248 (-) Transcript_16069:16-759(-)